MDTAVLTRDRVLTLADMYASMLVEALPHAAPADLEMVLSGTMLSFLSDVLRSVENERLVLVPAEAGADEGGTAPRALACTGS
jgi:hypothetical protein